jgi:hypothetical protein
LEELLRRLKASLVDEDWRTKVMDRLYGLGYTAVLLPGISELSQPESDQKGWVLGVNPDGSLLFQPENAEPRSVYGGEIRFVAPPQR